MRMVFINLPVADIDRAKAFYTGLGFALNPQFSNDQAGCIIVSDAIYVMVQTHDHFRQFVTGEIADPKAATAVLNCLSCDSREEVDDLLARALASGGAAWKPVTDQGFMYGASFQDPDGHVWELMWMDMAAFAAAQGAENPGVNADGG